MDSHHFKKKGNALERALALYKQDKVLAKRIKKSPQCISSYKAGTRMRLSTVIAIEQAIQQDFPEQTISRYEFLDLLCPQDRAFMLSSIKRKQQEKITELSFMQTINAINNLLKEQKKAEKTPIEGCLRNSDMLAKEMGLKNKYVYYKGKKVLAYGSPKLMQAVDDKTLPLSIAYLLCGLTHNEQDRFLNADKTTQRQLVAALKARTATCEIAPATCNQALACTDYISLLSTERALDSDLGFLRQLALGLVLTAIAGSHQGQRRDLVNYSNDNFKVNTKEGLKATLDEVKPGLAQCQRLLDEVNQVLDEVSPHLPKIQQVLNNVSGRLDIFIAKKVGFGSKDRFRQAETVGLANKPEVIAAIDAGRLSISKAAKTIKANHYHEEESQCKLHEE